MKDTKIAIVGTGFIGPVHVEALRRLGLDVAGLVESNQDLAKEKAAQLGINHAYASFDEMIADKSVDMVHITTPNFMHYPQVKAALEAGKHVVCEKPLAMNTTESAELVALAKERKLVNVVNFNLRFYPLSHHAKALVSQGKIGPVFIVQGSYLQDWLLYETDWNWRLEPGLGGDMRAVADIGSHWLDLTGFITGLKVKEVCADFATFLKTRKKPKGPIDTFGGKLLTPDDYIEQPINTEDYATILLRYENGSRGVFTVSQVSAGRKNRLSFEIDGGNGSMAWDSERPNELWMGHRNRPNELLLKDPSLLDPEARQFSSYPGGHNEGFPDTFKQLYYAVHRYITKGDFDAVPDFPTFADGHHEMKIGEAILRSAREGNWQAV